MRALRAERTAKQIISEILDKGLAESTWRDCNPGAYLELLKYRADLELSAKRVLVKQSEDRLRKLLG